MDLSLSLEAKEREKEAGRNWPSLDPANVRRWSLTWWWWLAESSRSTRLPETERRMISGPKARLTNRDIRCPDMPVSVYRRDERRGWPAFVRSRRRTMILFARGRKRFLRRFDAVSKMEDGRERSSFLFAGMRLHRSLPSLHPR